MRSLIMFFLLLTAGTAMAASEHLLQGDKLRLRAKPAADATVLGIPKAGMRVTAIDFLGDWAKVDPHQDGHHTGWIERSRLSSEAIAAFSLELEQRDARLAALTGERYFAGSRETGPGKLEVVGTDAWLAQPAEAREDALRILAQLWQDRQAPEHAARPVEVAIVDKAGERRMQLSTDPGTPVE